MILNLKLPDFKEDRAGSIKDLLMSIFVAFIFTYFFYYSLWALPIMLVPGFFLFVFLTREREKRREREFLLQFKECIQTVATSMRAGYAVENAFADSIKDMTLMFGQNSRIVREISILRQGIRNSRPVEEMLRMMAENSHLNELMEFAEVFGIAKRSGGNLGEIIATTAEMIGRKIELEEEIQVYLASKKMQQSVMNIMPMIILIYMKISNPGYLTPLYHNPTGVCLMTLCLLVYILAFVLSQVILNKA